MPHVAGPLAILKVALGIIRGHLDIYTVGRRSVKRPSLGKKGRRSWISIRVVVEILMLE